MSNTPPFKLVSFFPMVLALLLRQRLSTRMPIYANYPAIFRQRECENQFCQIILKSDRILINRPRNLWNFWIPRYKLKIKIRFPFSVAAIFAFYSIFLCICSYNFNGDCLVNVVVNSCLVNVVVNSCGFQFCRKSWQFWLTSVSLAMAFLKCT